MARRGATDNPNLVDRYFQIVHKLEGDSGTASTDAIERFSNNDQRSPLGLQIQSFRRHALIQQSKQRTEGLGLMRLALAIIPPWAAKLKVAEQSLKRHRMVSFEPLGFPTVRAGTLSFQVFLYLLLSKLGPLEAT